MITWYAYFGVLNLGKKRSRAIENQVVKEKIPPEEASLASFVSPNLQ